MRASRDPQLPFAGPYLTGGREFGYARCVTKVTFSADAGGLRPSPDRSPLSMLPRLQAVASVTAALALLGTGLLALGGVAARRKRTTV